MILAILDHGYVQRPQISQAIIIENLELAPILTQNALFDVMRYNRMTIHDYHYPTSELFCIIALIGSNSHEYDVLGSPTPTFTLQMVSALLCNLLM